MSISKIFIPNSLCVFSQMKDTKQIRRDFYSVAWFMPRVVTCGCWGESKTLVWGFAMAPHRLCTLVITYFEGAQKNIEMVLLSTHNICFD